MTRGSLYREMRREADPLWQAVFAHPFVNGIGDGTLSRDRFEFYLRQDYAYLIDFSRVIALACAKSPSLGEMKAFAALLGAILDTEMELHRKTCAAFGIPAEELETTRRALVTSAYTDFLVRTCYEGGLPEILAALSPCACGYAEIGQRLESAGLPDDPFCREWIRTYASRDFQDLAGWLIEKTDEHAGSAAALQRARLYRLYETSARFEYLFFDMGWEKKDWPATVPRRPEASGDDR